MSSEQNKLKTILVEKLFRGVSSEDEIAELLRTIKEDENSLDDQLLDRIWDLIPNGFEIGEGSSDRILQKIQAKVDFMPGEGVNTTGLKNKSESAYKLGWTSIAASLLLLVGFGFWILRPESSELVVKTAFGEQQDLQLADGSKVKLNANTKMVYGTDWSNGIDREVWLDGEAFFEVTKKPQQGQRFKVNTNAATIEVLGTSFNVNSHRDRISVYLEEGQIKLHLIKLDSFILMRPGDLIVYRESDGEIVNKHKVETEYHTSWKNGVLMFRSSPLSEVLQRIEETYGVEFQVKDSVDNMREINFPLPIDKLETAISILNKTMVDLEIRKEGDKYIIY